MNDTQIRLIITLSINDIRLREAVTLHLCGGFSARAAEFKVYGKQTNTVSRSSKKINRFVYFIERVNALG